MEVGTLVAAMEEETLAAGISRGWCSRSEILCYGFLILMYNDTGGYLQTIVAFNWL